MKFSTPVPYTYEETFGVQLEESQRWLPTMPYTEGVNVPLLHANNLLGIGNKNILPSQAFKMKDLEYEDLSFFAADIFVFVNEWVADFKKMIAEKFYEEKNRQNSAFFDCDDSPNYFIMLPEFEETVLYFANFLTALKTQLHSMYKMLDGPLCNLDYIYKTWSCWNHYINHFLERNEFSKGYFYTARPSAAATFFQEFLSCLFNKLDKKSFNLTFDETYGYFNILFETKKGSATVTFTVPFRIQKLQELLDSTFEEDHLHFITFQRTPNVHIEISFPDPFRSLAFFKFPIGRPDVHGMKFALMLLDDDWAQFRPFLYKFEDHGHHCMIYHDIAQKLDHFHYDPKKYGYVPIKAYAESRYCGSLVSVEEKNAHEQLLVKAFIGTWMKEQEEEIKQELAQFLEREEYLKCVKEIEAKNKPEEEPLDLNSNGSLKRKREESSEEEDSDDSGTREVKRTRGLLSDFTTEEEDRPASPATPGYLSQAREDVEALERNWVAFKKEKKEEKIDLKCNEKMDWDEHVPSDDEEDN